MATMMEIFSQSSRPAAFLIGGCLNWAGLFALGITFPFAVVSALQKNPLLLPGVNGVPPEAPSGGLQLVLRG